MKKQVQKIKENKGFSMIELIIVVAIMAILVGIIGAALIPYMEKSRASKDKSAMDGMYTAFASAIAETENPSDLIGSGGSNGLSAAGKAKVDPLVDGGSVSALISKMKSKQFKNGTITFYYNSEQDYGVVLRSSGYADVKIDNNNTESPVGVKSSGGSGGSSGN